MKIQPRWFEVFVKLFCNFLFCFALFLFLLIIITEIVNLFCVQKTGIPVGYQLNKYLYCWVV